MLGVLILLLHGSLLRYPRGETGMVIVNSSVLFSLNEKEDKRVAFNTGLIVDCTRSPSTRFSREAEWAHTHTHIMRKELFFSQFFI